MNKDLQKGLAPLVVVLVVLAVVVLGGGVWYAGKSGDRAMITPVPANSVAPTNTVQVPGDGTVPMPDLGGKTDIPPAREFVMTSYFEMIDGKPKTFFSLKEIRVKKGDLVRIKVTNTKGSHDFVIDEYKIKEMTPLNEEVVIEFRADKAGTFKYYCSVPNHRALGQEGDLIVEE